MSRSAKKAKKPSRSNNTRATYAKSAKTNKIQSKTTKTAKKSKSKTVPTTITKTKRLQITSVDQDNFPGYYLGYRSRGGHSICIALRNMKSNHGMIIQRQIYMILSTHKHHSTPKKLDYNKAKSYLTAEQQLSYNDSLASYI